MDKIKKASEKGYVVTKDGDVIYKGKKRKLNFYSKNDKLKYYSFNARIDGVVKKIKVHRLQAYQKYGDAIFEKGILVRHLDSNSLNNNYNNIAIGNSHDNSMDRPEKLRKQMAINASKSTLKYNHKEIYEYYCLTKSYKKTMEKFDIKSKNTINQIIKKNKNGE